MFPSNFNEFEAFKLKMSLSVRYCKHAQIKRLIGTEGSIMLLQSDLLPKKESPMFRSELQIQIFAMQERTEKNDNKQS